MKTQIPTPIKLTGPETDHLIQLLDDDQRKGEYYGNRGQYLARAKRIEKKLVDSMRQVRQGNTQPRALFKIKTDTAHISGPYGSIPI